MKWAIAALFGALVIIGNPVSAHHSSAMFDLSPEARKKLTGTVTKFAWTNPHVFIKLRVTQGGVSKTWDLELASPGSMRGSGFRHDMIKIGDKITIEVAPHRNGSPRAIVAGTIALANGKVWTPRGRVAVGAARPPAP